MKANAWPVSAQGGHGTRSEAKPLFHRVYLLLSPAEARTPEHSHPELSSGPDIQRSEQEAFGHLNFLPLPGQLIFGWHLHEYGQGLPELTLCDHL